MYMKSALLTATLAFSLSLHAGTPPKKVVPKANPPKQAVTKPSKQGTIEIGSLQYGVSNTASNPAPGTKQGQSSTGQINVGGGSKTNPCAAANPPKSCAQTKPAH
jgi:PPE-repeat protein